MVSEAERKEIQIKAKEMGFNISQYLRFMGKHGIFSILHDPKKSINRLKPPPKSKIITKEEFNMSDCIKELKNKLSEGQALLNKIPDDEFNEHINRNIERVKNPKPHTWNNNEESKTKQVVKDE